MWLINTKTLQLEEIDDHSTVKYAVLSHTWGDEEVSFKEMGRLSKAKRKKNGFAKIAKTCELAQQRGLQYAWVDTCCIDKTSSAELSEAINAMFPWYRDSVVCFVFLEDLSPTKGARNSSNPSRAVSSYRLRSSSRKKRSYDTMNVPHDLSGLASCRWFTRGWTLQELIAPRNVEFYDSGWHFLFTKEDMALTLSSITRIDIDILKMNKRIQDFPVAVRMYWAAHRQTRRPEDIAYSLLGIFDVNMPMLYGEGHKAFQRLQEQIASQTADASLFAWLSADKGQVYRGIFAESPAEFMHCRRGATMISEPEFAITNKGVRFQGALWGKPNEFSTFNLGLLADCQNCSRAHGILVGLFFTAKGYVRVSPWECWQVDESLGPFREPDIDVRKQISSDHSRLLEQLTTYPLKLVVDMDPGRISLRSWPREPWDPLRLAFSGDAFAEDFIGSTFITIRFQPWIQLVVFYFKLLGEKLEAELFVLQSADWKIDEGHAWKNIHDEIDRSSLLEKYRQEKQSGRYQQKTRVRVERTGLDGLLVSAEFQVDIKKEVQVRISQVSPRS